MSEITAYEFVINGGETIENGKFHWPDQITLKLDSYNVKYLMARLANSMLYDGDEFVLTYCGKIEKVEE